MWRWATSSELSRVVALAAVAWAAAAGAADLPTVEEALTLAFPDAEVERQSVFLSDGELARVAAASGVDGQPALVTRYVADGGEAGSAYLDTHRVRTLPETLLVVVGADGSLRRIEVVRFREPIDYLPSRRWYEQFEGMRLDRELELHRAIRPITGATLTARATTDTARRLLAVHKVLEEGAPQ